MFDGKIKKSFSIFLCFIIITSLLAGCSTKDNNKVSSSSSDEKISKSDFAKIIGEDFGYTNSELETDVFNDVSSENENYSIIQALSEWGVIEENSGDFKPDDNVDLGYAIKTAVRAIDTEKIKDADESFNESDLVNFYTSNIADIDTSDLDKKISKDVAKEISRYAVNYRNSLELPQKNEVNFNEGVKEADLNIKLNNDSSTGVIVNSNDYKVGDVVYFQPTDNETAKAIKITEINGEDFSYVDATLEEALESAAISGTYDCKVVSVRSVCDGVDVAGGGNLLYDEILENLNCNSAYDLLQLKNPNIKVEATDSSIACVFSASAKGKDASAEAKFSIGVKDIKATVNCKYKIGSGLENADLSLSFTNYVSGDVSGSFSKTIPLAEAEVVIPDTPLSIDILLEAHIGADGSISVSVENVNTISAAYKKGKSGMTCNVNSDTTSTFDFEASCVAELSLLVQLEAFSIDILNAEATTGVAAQGSFKGDILDDTYEGYIDIWIPLRLAVNKRPCLVTKIIESATYKKTIWDSKTSKYKWHKEFGNKDEKEAEKQDEDYEIKDDKGNAIDEIEMFDFEPIDFDFIELATYMLFLDVNSTSQIEISHIPEDYDESEIEYTVVDPNVCVVSATGLVTALNPGTTLIKVSTNDKTTTATIGVVVHEDLTVDFDPL
ncbi:Ig-like domain (group 2) [Lachnospiraceae bacterium RM5]|nr:Ig-like domain (group 2) [Lachnospiraceae bacterium RM5]